MKKVIFVLLVYSIVLVGTADSLAIGKLYGRIPWQENSPILNLDIKSYSVNVNIGDQMAVTRVVEEFSNTFWFDLEGVFVYELPEAAKLTEFAIWRDGERISYNLNSLDDAAEIYEEIITREDDPLFPVNDGADVYRVRIFPVMALNALKVEFSYIHMLPSENGDICYELPMDMTNYSLVPVTDLNVEIDITAQYRIVDLTCPNYSSLPECQIEQLTPTNFKVNFSANNLIPTADFNVKYDLQMESDYFNVLTYTPEDTSDDNYFTLWITPPDTLFQDTILVKEIVFAADLSSSMEGERLRNLKESLAYFINRLNPVDWFNIIPFSTDVSTFRSDLVRASDEMKGAAIDYVSQFSAVGLTNIEGALSNALAHQYSYRNRRIVILFTDGEPTAGVVDFATILENVNSNNAYDVSVFTVGIGDAVDKTLLNMISAQNKGYAFFINSEDSIAAKMNQLYPRIVVPALTDISLNFGAIQTFDSYPMHVSNMVQGMQQVVRGRYRGQGEVSLRLTGNVGSTPVVLQSPVAFLENTNNHISSLWAAGKIDYLLSLIEQHGEVQELVDAIVYLSKTYSILTPYTAFLLIQPGEGRPPSDVDGTDSDLRPLSYELFQNYPNPFNPTTTIKYMVGGIKGASQAVSLKIYNNLGEQVATLINADMAPGEYAIEWDATDGNGTKVAAGIYYYYLQIEGYKSVKAMVLIK